MSIFPFIDASGVTDTKKVTDLPLLKEYAYDYARNELLLSNFSKVCINVSAYIFIILLRRPENRLRVGTGLL